MNSRERFRETMRFGQPDHVPYFEEGLRDDVLEAWRRQGLPPEADLAEMFHMDRREQIPVIIEPIPKVEQWPTSRRDATAFRRHLRLDAPGRFPADWADKVRAWRTRGHILSLQLHRGYFLSMGVREWPRFQESVYLLMDDPALAREILDAYAEFAVRLLERVLAETDIDFAFLSEPIGGNDRPLLSPRQYEEVVLASYKPILEALKRRRVETVVYMTYANSRPLLPAVVRAGFNCLWATEANIQTMDYRSIRREFGRDLRLIGGIDLDTLLLDKEAIRREIETKVPPLLEQGGYIPVADGRVRANVPFENYVYYRRLTEEITR